MKLNTKNVTEKP